MILILGGTTEGRTAVRTADEGCRPYYYSTKGEGQEVACRNGIRLTGALDAAAMQAFCREKDIRLLIDAAHPFAEMLHRTLAETAARLHLPVVRLERNYPPRDESICWCDSFDDALLQLEKHGVRRLLALTGVQTIGRLRPYWQQHACWFRVLDRPESFRLAAAQGFPPEQVVGYTPGEATLPLLRRLAPDAILTKESGETGYFAEKVEAAATAGIPVFAVKRPPLPSSFIAVYGEAGLRKEIERLVPGFFAQRSGYTTGTCATAAAKAALTALLTGRGQQQCTLTLPSGEPIRLLVAQTLFPAEGTASCTVIKDAGDDPDVTHGCRLVATVRLLPCRQGYPPILLRGGEGIGIVTLPGLGIEVGAPAINATPRKMITEELTPLVPPGQCAEVTLSVPGGSEIARRTFNPKLGIEGGISIIGTSGIVRPFSTDAFIASIRKEIEVAAACGVERLVINSGAKSERFIKSRYPGLPPQAFVHYGNFIGETLRLAASLGIARITLGIMIGKAVKLAEGHLDTHSKKVVMNRDFLIDVANRAGCPPHAAEIIRSVTLARELWTALPAPCLPPFLSVLMADCRLHCAPLLPSGELTLLLIDEEGNIVE